MLKKIPRVTTVLKKLPLVIGKRFSLRNELYDELNYTYTTKLGFVDSCNDIPLFRFFDLKGVPLVDEDPEIEDSVLSKMFETMITCDILDDYMFKAQRQGKISFHFETLGETAAAVGSAAPLSPNDYIFSQYREAGALFWRGITLDQWIAKGTCTKNDATKGRSAPCAIGSSKLNILVVSPPLATQTIQAVGAGYAFRIDKEHQVAVTYIGEGATSEGDFHAAMNFAATLRSQTLFICRNNSYAISTPSNEQFSTNDLVLRAMGYGIKSIRVDGNDAIAVYKATQFARSYILREKKPVFLELVTYRVGHHSTSDFSGLYRTNEERDSWINNNNPILRLENYLKGQSIAYDRESKTAEIIQTIKSSLSKNCSLKYSPIKTLFTDVYDTMTDNLKDQCVELDNVIKEYPELIDTSSYELD